jgi:class 3 adenylate cyclase/CheY-like chemotaxis protein
MAPGSESGPEERLRRALLAHVRQDFTAPVGAVVGFAEILVEEAPRYGLEPLVPDLERIRMAALALQRLVDGLLDSSYVADRAGAGNDEAFRSRLRHDLRTPMNAVIGYGEMLLEDVVAAEAVDFVRDLEKMLAAAKRLLVRIDSLVDFAESGALTSTDAVRAPGRSLNRLSHLIRPVPAESGPAATIDSCRILVIDDHQSNRDLLARHLARDGHDVVTAEDGKRGLNLAENGAFDLVLLDLLMPRMSGYEVLCRLKSDSRYGGLPVIMISALDEIDSVVRCIEAGAEDYLPKPFDAVLLRARINSCLERKRLRDREKVFTEQLRREKEKSEVLLLNVLPKPIVARLQRGEEVIADRVSDATILFADLVGFTELSARLPATRLVGLLNLLFTDFDRLTVRFGLEKIKTIGDAYMVAGGVLEGGDDYARDHAVAAADMGLAMLESTRQASGKLDEPLQLRIGLHAGPVVAGIIGTHKFIYDIWGDTVNTASRLESHGAVGTLNVSVGIRQRLGKVFLIEPGGRVDLKGKGPTDIYHLRGRR